MARTCEEQLAQLGHERRRIEARRKRRYQAAERDHERLLALNAEEHRLRLAQLVGMPDAVKLRFRVPAGDRCAHLNGRLGTLTKVKRTRADVDFGPGDENWSMPLESLTPADR